MAEDLNNASLVLGGFRSTSGLADVVKQDMEKKRAASPAEKWIAKVMAGEMSPQEAAARAKAEMAGINLDQPMPRLTEGMDSKFGLKAPEAPGLSGGPPAPSARIGGSGGGAMSGPAVTAHQAPAGLSGGPGGFPGVETAEEYDQFMGGADRYAKIQAAKPKYRPEDSVNRIETHKGTVKSEVQGGLDEKKAKRQAERLQMKIDADYKEHGETLKFKYWNANKRMEELEKRLEVAKQRIGSNERVAAAMGLLQIAQAKQGNIKGIVTSTPGFLGDEGAMGVKGKTEDELEEMKENLEDAESVLISIAKGEKMLDDLEKEADTDLKAKSKPGAQKQPPGQYINGQPVGPGGKVQSTTHKRTSSGPVGLPPGPPADDPMVRGAPTGKMYTADEFFKMR